MKRILCLMLALVMLLSLTACGGGTASENKENNNGGASQQDPAPQDPDDDEKDDREETYQQVLKLLGEKNFEEAYKLLQKIQGYKDTLTMLTKFVWKPLKAVHSNDAGADLTTYYTYTYDDHGYAIASTYESDVISNSYTYENVYDDLGRIKSVTSNSSVGYQTIINYIYNEKGQLSCLSSNYNGSYVQDIFYYYNDLGQVIREEVPDTESVTEYTYDEKGNVTSMDGNMGTSTYVNIYDDHGRLVKYVRTDGEFSTTFTMTYDKNGTLVKEVSLGEDGFADTWEYSDFKLFYQG
ncbi:MAG: hypothetical protein J6K84_00070 [Oscillospiraceae bacterium]|nr:hypothetical protein [Oscillospiraceae bacterium]